MPLRVATFLLTGFVLTVCFAFNTAAQNRPDSGNLPTVAADKRAIIKLLLSDIFRGNPNETINLSTKNIPAQIRKNLPKFKDLTVRLVEDEEDACPFEFHLFAVSGREAFVLFGDCRSGLGYNFEKVRGRWRFAPVEIENRNQ